VVIARRVRRSHDRERDAWAAEVPARQVRVGEAGPLERIVGQPDDRVDARIDLGDAR
jgi:hypothetical protein